MPLARSSAVVSRKKKAKWVSRLPIRFHLPSFGRCHHTTDRQTEASNSNVCLSKSDLEQSIRCFPIPTLLPTKRPPVLSFLALNQFLLVSVTSAHFQKKEK